MRPNLKSPVTVMQKSLVERSAKVQYELLERGEQKKQGLLEA